MSVPPFSSLAIDRGLSERAKEEFPLTSSSLEKGDVQWMVAGRGVMHSEMPLFDPDPKKAVNSEALQLWVDLPADKKNIEPSYQEKKAKE